MNRTARLLVVALATTLTVINTSFAQILPGNIVVLRVGSGTGTLAATATAVNLQEFTTAGGAAVQTIVVSSTGATALTLTGTSTTQGVLNLSSDGALITFGGYRKDAGGTNPQSDTSAVTNRAIGVLSVGTGAVNTAQALTDSYSADSFRSVVTSDGSNFYTSGAGNTTTGGVRFVAGTAATTSTALNNANTGNPNTRQVVIQNGNLYVSSGAGNPGLGIFQVGSGLPTTGTQTYTSLVTPTTSVNSYVFAREGTGVTGNGTGADTIYAADNVSILKYSFNGTAWVANGSIARAGVNNLTLGALSGSTQTVYGTDGTTLFSLNDASGFGANITGTITTLATADANTAFRGLVLIAPVPEPATVVGLSALGLGAAGFVRRRRAARLKVA